MPSNDPVVPGTTGILLAAGASQRMGLPKPLLSLHGMPMVAWLSHTLLQGGVERLIVVTSSDLAPQIQRGLATHLSDPPEVVISAAPEAGMLSSVQSGIVAAGTTDAVAICPCDLPLLTPEPVYAILHYWSDRLQRPQEAIVVPVANGKRGHPALFGSCLLPAILALDPRKVGLNILAKERPGLVQEVSVDAEGVWQDADTPEEWRQWMGTPPICWQEP